MSGWLPYLLPASTWLDATQGPRPCTSDPGGRHTEGMSDRTPATSCKSLVLLVLPCSADHGDGTALVRLIGKAGRQTGRNQDKPLRNFVGQALPGTACGQGGCLSCCRILLRPRLLQLLLEGLDPTVGRD